MKVVIGWEGQKILGSEQHNLTVFHVELPFQILNVKISPLEILTVISL